MDADQLIPSNGDFAEVKLAFSSSAPHPHTFYSPEEPGHAPHLQEEAWPLSYTHTHTQGNSVGKVRELERVIGWVGE